MTAPNPAAIEAIDHVVIATSNLAVMQAFYEIVFGCRVERTLPDLGLVQMRAGSALIDLLAVDHADAGEPPGAHRNMDHLCLSLKNWDHEALQAHLAQHGVCTEEPARRYGASGMGQSIYISDPDGNRIELKAPAGNRAAPRVT